MAAHWSCCGQSTTRWMRCWRTASGARRVVAGLFAYDDQLVRIVERLGTRHVPAQLTKLSCAIATEATE
jgi:hypothetical protein